MRLRTHILLWALLAAVLPVALLGAAASGYLEERFHRELGDQVDVSLRSALSAIERQLVSEREMLRRLAQVPPLAAYLPVLEASGRGWRHPFYQPTTARLVGFLESFQLPVATFNLLRVIDPAGRTLVKLRGERHVPADFLGLDGLPYPEEEFADRAFVTRLEPLPAGKVGFLELPHNRRGLNPPQRLPMLDAVVPLEQQGRRAGYLAATTWGVHVDRALELVPRLFGARLLIAELDADEPGRHGLLLYDDALELRFTDQGRPPQRLAEVYPAAVQQRLESGGTGRWEQAEGDRAWFKVELYPYPDRLTRWVLAAHIDRAELAAPFARLRLVLVASALLALLLSLALAQWGARQVAAPVDRLARHLEAYADGASQRRAAVAGVAELQRLGGSFNYMADTLERAEQELQQHARLAGIGRMAAGLAHEINNPLNNVLAYLKLAERGLPEGGAAARSDLHAARDEALRAAAIIRGVLDFARQGAPLRAPFAVGDWLAAGVAAVGAEAAQHRVGIDLDDRCPGVSCDGDRGQLLQALVNLLRNAVQASPEGGTVSLMAEDDGEWLQVTVRDHGAGLAAEARERLFEPFYTSKPVGVGTGLGLAVSLGLVEQHGGSLALENHPEGGVEARLRVPLAAPGGPA